ncbi:MAG: Crp/Fnr family transcriptional regulator [Lentisphaerales bacterium]|nr:Crp/Fnr family transcriptional regulator [Lentisphaerales bacterium]
MAINHIEDLNLPEITVKAGDNVLEEGAQSSKIYILQSGCVKVTANGEELCEVDVKGAVFGDMSVLLGRDTSAEVKVTEDSTFILIDDAANYLKTQPELIFGIAQILATRLVHMNEVFVGARKNINNSTSTKIKKKLYSWMMSTNNFFDRDIMNPFQEAQVSTEENN